MLRLLGLWWLPVVSLAFAGGIWTMNLATPAHFDDRQKLWQEVDQAQNEGLPRTAIEKLDQIYEGAIADEAWPEAIRAPQSFRVSQT